MTGESKISCRSLWKVFGAAPGDFLARHGMRPSPEAFKKEGYIGAVQDVSFDVKQGEILIIMGLSGSGKSTLIRCLTRLIEPTVGEVVFEGRNLLATSEREMIELRRHKLGMVFQHFGLLPHRSVLANVAFPLEVQGVPRAKREARAREMVKLVGLEGREDYFPRELSGGQQQRVGIARSLAVEPDIWFLDEPFSALDPLIRYEMQGEFLKLQRILKKTIVFITHDFEEATRLADRIGIMKDGQLIQLATPEEMVTAPADPYVAEFTKNAPRERIISVGSLAEPLGASAVRDNPIPAATKIGSIAARVLGSDAPIAIVDDDARLIGEVSRNRIVAALFREGRA